MGVNFKHLKPEEAKIFQRALDKGLFKGSLEFDVHVGEGFHENHDPPCTTACDDFRMLTQKRIDAVERTPSGISIIEITPRLSSRALGQLLCYRDCYSRMFPSGLPVKLYAVVSETDEDLEATFKHYQIEIIIA